LKQPRLIILDGLKAHSSALVREYLDSTDGAIKIAFLPPYSPDLLGPGRALVMSPFMETSIAICTVANLHSKLPRAALAWELTSGRRMPG